MGERSLCGRGCAAQTLSHLTRYAGSRKWLLQIESIVFMGVPAITEFPIDMSRYDLASIMRNANKAADCETLIELRLITVYSNERIAPVFKAAAAFDNKYMDDCVSAGVCFRDSGNETIKCDILIYIK